MIEDGFEFCKPYLELYEYVIWTGRPNKQSFPIFYIIHFILSILFIAVGIALLVFAIISMTIPLILFMCFWIAIVIKSMVNSMSKGLLAHKNIAYVITNKKIIRSQGFKVDMVDISPTPEIDILIKENGSGNIYIKSEAYHGTKKSEKFNFRTNDYFVLYDIPDVKTVFDKIKEV